MESAKSAVTAVWTDRYRLVMTVPATLLTAKEELPVDSTGAAFGVPLPGTIIGGFGPPTTSRYAQVPSRHCDHARSWNSTF